jgi:tetratricopeptide (TPR) repeat protein
MMMRRLLFFIFLIGLQTVGWSQPLQHNISTETKTIDSLKRGLVAAQNDSSRIKIMQRIGFTYELLNLDSSLKYTQAGLALARDRNYPWGETMLMTDLATILREQGKLAESLELLFNSLKIAETNNITSEIARGYRRLSDVYLDLKSFPKAIEYLSKALKIDEGNQNKKSAAIDNVTLGYAFEKMNKLDSASFYAGRAFQQKDFFGFQYVYQVLGNIQVKKRNYEKATQLFREGLMLCQKNDDFLTASDICADISALFINLNKTDSAIFYASKGFDYGQSVSYKKGVMLSGNLLAELYDSTKPEVALKYFKIVAAAKDSLFGVDNIQTIQNLVSREEAKQKELEDAQISYRNRLKIYGLLAGFRSSPRYSVHFI